MKPLLALAALLACAPLAAGDGAWSLELQAVRFDKLQQGGELYYWFHYRVTNPGKAARRPRLHLFAVIDRLREGVSPDEVRAFDGFRGHKLPPRPASETEPFDIGGPLRKLKRYYDMPYAEALPAVLAKIGRKVPHTSALGELAPGATAEAVALFKGVDRQMDYLGIVVKGLRNRVRAIGDRYYLEDRVRLFKYSSPGDAAGALENKLVPAGVEWVVLRRERLPAARRN